MFIPYNINNVHWVLFVLDCTTGNYEVYDSLMRVFVHYHGDEMEKISRYMYDKYRYDHAGKECPFQFRSKKVVCPQQPEDSNDCAIYVFCNLMYCYYDSMTNQNSRAYSKILLAASNENRLRILMFNILCNGCVF